MKKLAFQRGAKTQNNPARKVFKAVKNRRRRSKVET